jgi:hypothetical protein
MEIFSSPAALIFSRSSALAETLVKVDASSSAATAMPEKILCSSEFLWMEREGLFLGGVGALS